MAKAADLVYDDAPWFLFSPNLISHKISDTPLRLSSSLRSDSKLRFMHSRIPLDVAAQIGGKSLRTLLLAGKVFVEI